MAGSGRTLTYRQLDEASRRLAAVLHTAGLRRGHVVGLLTDNRPPAFEVLWAALRSGLYLTTVNHHLSADEAAYIVRDAGVRALIVSAGTAELAEAVVAAVPADALRLAYDGPVRGYESYTEALAAEQAYTHRQPPETPGALMLYSSGTTGRPKGIRPELPTRRVDEAGDPITGLVQDLYGVGPDTVYLSPAPIYHSAPVKWSTAVQALGGTVIMMERFDAEGVLRAIDEHDVSHAQFVPTMFVRILALDPSVRARHDVSSLRVAVHAAAPCPVDVKRRMIEEWGPVLYEYYGSTEAVGVTMIDSHRWQARPGSVGRAALGVVHICAADGAELPTGHIGTVYFERDAMPFAYHNDPEATAAARHPRHRNWATVGDLGYLDADGYLFLTGRKGFVIISGGVNVYPREVEDAAVAHPDVLDVAVIGVEHAELGEAVAAFVELVAGVEPTPERERDIIDFVRSRIAHYKAPRSVTFMASLPRTPTGKLLKGELAEHTGRAAT